LKIEGSIDLMKIEQNCKQVLFQDTNYESK
jgi:hypothetical protein